MNDGDPAGLGEPLGVEIGLRKRAPASPLRGGDARARDTLVVPSRSSLEGYLGAARACCATCPRPRHVRARRAPPPRRRRGSDARAIASRARPTTDARRRLGDRPPANPLDRERRHPRRRRADGLGPRPSPGPQARCGIRARTLPLSRETSCGRRRFGHPRRRLGARPSPVLLWERARNASRRHVEVPEMLVPSKSLGLADGLGETSRERWTCFRGGRRLARRDWNRTSPATTDASSPIHAADRSPQARVETLTGRPAKAGSSSWTRGSRLAREREREREEERASGRRRAAVAEVPRQGRCSRNDPANRILAREGLLMRRTGTIAVTVRLSRAGFLRAKVAGFETAVARHAEGGGVKATA